VSSGSRACLQTEEKLIPVRHVKILREIHNGVGWREGEPWFVQVFKSAETCNW
jgi:hypothetical protein